MTYSKGDKISRRDNAVHALANFVLRFGSNEYQSYISVLGRLGQKYLEEIALSEELKRLGEG
jgi:hypothetical protein